ncbi:hypothetical protein [Leptotrichia sp. oral taxon 879]|uniref:hypothetical protein n=1 Tax=Leptotrichia sp. oral taxon 879 TaxID=1227267 RepID=UPI0003AE35C3|nr:hypothetical protein [Leptotrichia sp. oral taxon 879]ERK51787.1 hypothetical protein HMPREF1552_00984 [Leptotrichia sp. oral taxon 879 str. F0557]
MKIIIEDEQENSEKAEYCEILSISDNKGRAFYEREWYSVRIYTNFLIKFLLQNTHYS